MYNIQIQDFAETGLPQSYILRNPDKHSDSSRVRQELWRGGKELGHGGPADPWQDPWRYGQREPQENQCWLQIKSRCRVYYQQLFQGFWTGTQPDNHFRYLTEGILLYDFHCRLSAFSAVFRRSAEEVFMKNYKFQYRLENVDFLFKF